MKNDNENHFFLVSQNLKTIRLDRSQPISIGREKFNDVVLNDLRVSRQHAMIGWEGGRFYVKDLKSSNGTFLNNEKLEKSSLGDGDIIKVGSQEFIMRAASKMNVEELLLKERSRLACQQTQVYVMPAINFNEGGFSGDLSTLAIIEVVQTLSQCLKTGELTITQADNKDQKTVLYFDVGEIVHVTHPFEQGIDAVVTVLKLKEGQFVFANDVPAPDHTIQDSTMSILLEACRVIDESLPSPI